MKNSEIMRQRFDVTNVNRPINGHLSEQISPRLTITGLELMNDIHKLQEYIDSYEAAKEKLISILNCRPYEEKGG